MIHSCTLPEAMDMPWASGKYLLVDMVSCEDGGDGGGSLICWKIGLACGFETPIELNL
jgi:hypothetical protein